MNKYLCEAVTATSKNDKKKYLQHHPCTGWLKINAQQKHKSFILL